MMGMMERGGGSKMGKPLRCNTEAETTVMMNGVDRRMCAPSLPSSSRHLRLLALLDAMVYCSPSAFYIFSLDHHQKEPMERTRRSRQSSSTDASDHIVHHLMRRSSALGSFFDQSFEYEPEGHQLETISPPMVRELDELGLDAPSDDNVFDVLVDDTQPLLPQGSGDGRPAVSISLGDDSSPTATAASESVSQPLTAKHVTYGGDNIHPASYEETMPASPSTNAAAAGSPQPMSNSKKVITALLYGLINAIILIPVLISFAQIIFRDKYFDSAMPYLIKLVILSSCVHQLVFSIFSSLPFAIGQVQDAGLIFLSSMATSIVRHCEERNCSRNETFATVLCWLAISTASLGVALLITGKLKLASLVQYLPMPVVGGYLAFIGFYCMEAGFSLMSGVQILSVLDWGHLFHRDAAILMAPGIGIGIALFFITGKFRHFAVLPCCLLAIPTVFHIALLIGNISLEDARTAFDEGWLAPQSNRSEFWLVYEHFEFGKVDWSAIPSVIPTWLAMYFVVAFSSSLDVAAIQMELGRSLDFNHELMTVGLSNLVSGLTGGYTGSYIFSQTIFTMRAKIESRLVGFIVIALSLIAFMLPISILAYIPKFFFGAILTFIAIDLLYCWLIQAFRLVHWTEFLIIWGTFIAINATNLEVGMAIGIGLSILVFILKYARTNVTQLVHKRSHVLRGYTQREILGQEENQLAVMELSGYIFFGSALSILNDVKRILRVSTSPARSSSLGSALSSTSNILVANYDQRPTYLVLDFRHVSGIDATAMRTCFVTIKQLMVQHNGVVALCSLTTEDVKLMRAHGVVPPQTEQPSSSNRRQHVRVFDTVEDALVWCEDQILKDAKAVTPTPATLSLSDILLTYVVDAHTTPNPALLELAQRTSTLFEKTTYEAGDVIFVDGQLADHLYFLLEGEVSLVKERHALRPVSSLANLNEIFQRLRQPSRTSVFDTQQRMPRELDHLPGDRQRQSKKLKRRFNCYPGSVFGDMAFVLKQSRDFRAEAVTRCVVCSISRDTVGQLEEEGDAAYGLLSSVLARSLALALHNHAEALFV
eukprot:m.155285 g.155285  ORF g.155285 m.155285 type:complete len:1051 (+) comp16274_c0_seq1:16-3168(+)